LEGVSRILRWWSTSLAFNTETTSAHNEISAHPIGRRGEKDDDDEEEEVEVKVKVKEEERRRRKRRKRCLPTLSWSFASSLSEPKIITTTWGMMKWAMLRSSSITTLIKKNNDYG